MLQKRASLELALQDIISEDSLHFKTNLYMKNAPPESLIRTWVWMMSETNNPEIMNKGRQNLINAFGSLHNAIQYIEEQVDLTEKATTPAGSAQA